MIKLERLKELLDYDCSTGLFTWRVKTGKAQVGMVAGRPHFKKGYIEIKIDRSTYLAHRLAWFYVNGDWPNRQIDHINCVRNDNRISNLREASPTQNNANSYRRVKNKSGYKGVSWHSQTGRWQARISVARRERNLGLFSSPEEAHHAYRKEAERSFGEFARFQ